MAVRSNLISQIAPKQYAVGLSSIIGITGIQGQISVSVQYISGGTLEIVNPDLNVKWGQGWSVPAYSISSFDLTSTLYLASSGATTVVSVVVGRSEGFAGSSLGFVG